MSDPITDGALALSKMPQPRYLALAKSLAAEIARGAVVPGDRLPGERELCRSFGVSRVTVRRALAELRDQGMIEPDGPRGWFVLSASLGEPNDLVVCRKDGSAMNPDTFSTAWPRLLARAGLPHVRFHDLRHMRRSCCYRVCTPRLSPSDWVTQASGSRSIRIRMYCQACRVRPHAPSTNCFPSDRRR